jgi:uncharacterized protein YdhG (YjbR/CyaY superfamily)
MIKSDTESKVDKYLKSVIEPQRAELERIRRIVRQLVSEAYEVISYGMPGYKYKGKLETTKLQKEQFSLLSIMFYPSL